MTTWYVSAGKVYDGPVLEALNNASLSLGSVDVVQQHHFPMKFSMLTATAGSSQGIQLCLIVDADCVSVIQTLLKFVERVGKRRLAGLKVIALSSLISWGGTIYEGIVSASLDNFRSRVPLSSAFPQYALENALVTAAARHEVTLHIVGSGLFYGLSGLDLKNIFSFIWGKKTADDVVGSADVSTAQMMLPCNSSACVPVINISRFVDIVLSAQSVCDRQPHFIAAVDSATDAEGRILSFCEMISALDRRLNDRQESLIVANCGSGEGEGAVLSPLWQCSLPLASSSLSSVNLLNSIDEVWEQFLRSNSLAPVSIALAGPPRVGKSDLAGVIAEKLQLEHVTPESAVRFLHRLDLANVPGAVTSAVLSATDSVDNSTAWRQAKDELRAAAEAKANEGKKPAKGAAVVEEGTVDEAVFTSAFCLTLAPELVRKCMAALVTLHPVCKRRGYVLDAWDGRVLTGADSLGEVLNAQGGASRSLELLVELQCPANFPVERLVSSQGAQAKAKESQAAVKALEPLVSAYNSNLVALDVAPDAVEHMKTGHKGVVEILAVSTSCQAHRVNAAVSLEGQVLADTAQSIVETAVSLKGGCIGWLDTPSSSSGTQHKEDLDHDSPSDDTASGKPVSPENAPDLLNSLDLSPGDAPPLSALAKEIQQLEADKLTVLSDKAAKLQAFLSATVLPQVTEGLVRIQREQPQDPILFLAQQLMRHSMDRNSQAEEKARVRFIDLLHQGGF